MSDAMLARRRGGRPRTTSTIPHTQLDQQTADGAVRAELVRRAFDLPGVRERASGIAVPGTRALWLDEMVTPGPDEAFLVGREFAHLHPVPDQSLHLSLPPDLGERAIAAGWAELHLLAQRGAVPPSIVMVYAPRDRQELEVVYALLLASYRFAGGGPAA
jgi:hypothetical protein